MQVYLPIVFEDEYFVAINKPSKMLVHRSKIDKHETVFALQTLREQLNQRVYPLHRLDKPTSGVLLFAKSSDYASAMQTAFAEHNIQKHYLAVLRGHVKENLVIDYPLAEALDKMTDNLDKDNPKKEAVTGLEVLNHIELDSPVGRYQSARFTLVELCPQTGRKHQLRRHMAHIRHPIIGDTTHGDGKQNRFFREYFDCHRLLLHASQLRFQHPFTQKDCHIQADLDDTFARIVKRFG